MEDTPAPIAEQRDPERHSPLLEKVLTTRSREFDRRMIHNADNSLLYVAVPKTGCTTIKTIVAAATGVIDTNSKQYRSSNGAIHKTWLNSMEVWSRVSSGTRNEMLFGESTIRITSVRNPYERAVSCYLDKIAAFGEETHLGRTFLPSGKRSFLAFLEFVRDEPSAKADVHASPIVDLNYAPGVRYDIVVRYESFHRDVAGMMGRLGLAGAEIPVPRFATNAGKKIGEYVGEKEKALIREIYTDDFKAFGYPDELPS